MVKRRRRNPLLNPTQEGPPSQAGAAHPFVLVGPADAEDADARSDVDEQQRKHGRR